MMKSVASQTLAALAATVVFADGAFAGGEPTGNASSGDTAIAAVQGTGGGTGAGTGGGGVVETGTGGVASGTVITGVTITVQPASSGTFAQYAPVAGLPVVSFEGGQAIVVNVAVDPATGQSYQILLTENDEFVLVAVA